MLKPPHEAMIRTPGFLVLELPSQYALRVVWKPHQDTVIEVPDGCSHLEVLERLLAPHGIFGREAIAAIWRDWERRLGATAEGDVCIPLLSGDKARKPRKAYERPAERPAPLTPQQKMERYRAELDGLVGRQTELRAALLAAGVVVGSPAVGAYAKQLRPEIERLEGLLRSAGAAVPPVPPGPRGPTSAVVTENSVTEKSNGHGNGLGNNALTSVGHGGHLARGESSLSPDLQSPNFFQTERETRAGEAVTELGRHGVTLPVAASSSPAPTPPSAPIIPGPSVPTGPALALDPEEKRLVDGDLAARAIEQIVGNAEGRIGAEFGHKKAVLARVMRERKIKIDDVRCLARVVGALGVHAVWSWKHADHVDGPFLLAPGDSGEHLAAGVTKARELEGKLLGAARNDTPAGPSQAAAPALVPSPTAHSSPPTPPPAPRPGPIPAGVLSPAEQLAGLVGALPPSLRPRAKVAGG